MTSGGAVLLDTGILYAYYDRSDAWHARARRLVEAHPGGLVVPAPVIPEVDHLLGHRLTPKAQEVFCRGLAEGDYVVADLPHGAYARVLALNRQFADLRLGFVDAAVVAIAESVGLTRIGTTDRRHFEPLAAALSLEVVP
jgi:predicted nucleic acid-binding protein